MTSKRILSGVLPIALLAVLSCSKTADTAPERRIFGSPPTIETVDPNFYNPQAPVDCDFTDIVNALLCQNGILDAQPQTGTGWTKTVDPNDPNKTIVVFSDVPTTVPGTFIEGTYTELSFTAKVTDPETTSQQNNVLLVSASYVPPNSTTEITLVLFDDGSQIDFPFEQRALVGEDCEIDIPNQVCTCGGAVYKIKSGDLVKGDNVYTRKFALANPTASTFLNDCVMRSKKEIPVSAAAGNTLQFKIEAVDRQGNLASWPTKLPVVVGAGSFVCNGDSCGCCLLHAFSQLADITECHNQPGMISPSAAPDGVCVDIIPG